MSFHSDQLLLLLLLLQIPQVDWDVRRAVVPALAKIADKGDAAAFEAKLKGSIGEGSNHSNFSDRSSVRILAIIQEFSLENLKIPT